MKPTFIQRLIDSCEQHSGKLAMRVVGDESQDVTFGEFLDQIRGVAKRLIEEGLEKGERVAVIGENHPSWAVAYLGILYAGGVCMPLDPHGETQTLANFFTDSEAKTVFAGADSIGRIDEIEGILGRQLRAIVWDVDGLEVDGDRGMFSKWSEAEVPLDFANAAPIATPDDNAVLIYTSGTTGKPKGVLLTHGNINAELDAIDGVLEFTDRESVLSLLPLFHAYLQIVNLWLAVTKGAKVFYLKELTPDELSQAMVESKMTALASVPRLWYLFHKKIFDAVEEKPAPVQLLFRFLLALNGFTRDYLGINLGKTFFKKVHDSFGGHLDLAVTAGSRFDESVAVDFHRLGFTILQGYGLSETSGAATGTYIDDNRVGSVGKPMGDAEVRIADQDANGEGEVQIRGSMVFNGYYRNPEATAEAFTEDGWFKSGDLGKFDEDGHLYITGRAKDVIVLPSGKNVHPEDLEVHYLKSPLVEEMCVIGVADESAGRAGAEKLIGVVVPDFEYLRRNKIANSGEAIRFDLDGLGRELPEYQRVRDYVVRTEPLPRTATRKIKRFELRKSIGENADAEVLARKSVWEFSEEDRALLASPHGELISSLVVSQKPEIGEIHPDMNLEIDLRLDSLGRAEIVAALEQALGVEFKTEDVSEALTFREVVGLTRAAASGDVVELAGKASFNWTTIIREVSPELPEVRHAIRRTALFELFAFSVLSVAHLCFRILFRLEIKGAERLKEMDGPYLICPNHQSYVDPFFVCSAYPYKTLRDTFHVGASEYFQSWTMGLVARMLKIVPIDPDTQLLKAMKAGAAGLKSGKILNIYPEGERAFDGELHKFKSGAAILAKEMDLPIVPVAIDGLHKVWGRGSKSIRAAKVRIEFFEPIKAGENESYENLTERLKEVIATGLTSHSDVKPKAVAAAHR